MLHFTKVARMAFFAPPSCTRIRSTFSSRSFGSGGSLSPCGAPPRDAHHHTTHCAYGGSGFRVTTPCRQRFRGLGFSARDLFMDLRVQLPAGVPTLSSSVAPPLYRLRMELFTREAPIASQNFQELCTGKLFSEEDPQPEAALNQERKEKRARRHGPCFLDNDTDAAASSIQLLPSLCYRRSRFHRLHKGFVLQGGDLTDNSGRHQQSVFGDHTFDAPNEVQQSGVRLTNLKRREESCRGLLGTACSAPHLHGSQFFVLLTADPARVQHLVGHCIIFGRVKEESWPALQAIEHVPVQAGGEIMEGAAIIVEDCGQL